MASIMPASQLRAVPAPFRTVRRGIAHARHRLMVVASEADRTRWVMPSSPVASLIMNRFRRDIEWPHLSAEDGGLSVTPASCSFSAKNGESACVELLYSRLQCSAPRLSNDFRTAQLVS